MVICHCNRIDSEAIEATCRELCQALRFGPLTAEQVYRQLGKQPKCGGCLPLAQQCIETHLSQATRCMDCPMARLDAVALPSLATAANDDDVLAAAL